MTTYFYNFGSSSSNTDGEKFLTFFSASSIIGTWSWGAVSGKIMGGTFDNGTSHANGDTVTLKNIYLRAGTYTSNLIHATNSNGGIVKIKLNSTVIHTVDMYSVGLNYDVKSTQTSISIAEGIYDISFVVDGKNGASSSYTAWLQCYSLVQTA